MTKIELRKWCFNEATEFTDIIPDRIGAEDIKRINKLTGEDLLQDQIKYADLIYNWVTGKPTAEQIKKMSIDLDILKRLDSEKTINETNLDDILDYRRASMDITKDNPITDGEPLFSKTHDKPFKDTPLNEEALAETMQLINEWDNKSSETWYSRRTHDNPEDQKWVLTGEAKEYYESLKKPPLVFDPIYLARVDEIPELMDCIENTKDSLLYVGDLYFIDKFVKIKDGHIQVIFNIESRYKIRIDNGCKRPSNIEELREQYKDEIEARIKG